MTEKLPSPTPIHNKHSTPRRSGAQKNIDQIIKSKTTIMTETTSMGEALLPGSTRGKSRLVSITVFAFAVFGATAGYNSYHNETESPIHEERRMSAVDIDNSKSPISVQDRVLESESDDDKEEALIKKIAEKLQPVPLRFFDDEEEGDVQVGEITTEKIGGKDGEVQKRTMLPHQFLHLHHMKTGGTSMDRLLRCAMNRLKKESNYNVPYYSIHECSRKRFADCLTQPENKCRALMDDAAMMSYCSALKYLDEFGWWHDNNENNKVKAITVLRNPVDRVWSMFRFQTKNCYKCQPLKDIYKKLESGEDTGVDKLCSDQLQNHEVNNLLSTEWPVEVSALDLDGNEEHVELSSKMVQEAIENMKGFFTVIGITEKLPETADIIGKVFPWMSLDGSEEHNTTSQCQLPHANASPKNNRCGEGNTHWDLPDQPDQETYDLIVKHNSLDMELYKAAVYYFELQQKALERNSL